MRFFFSGELDGDLPDDHYRVVSQIVETRLNEALIDKNYESKGVSVNCFQKQITLTP